MPLARNFNGTRVVTTVMDGFLDRLSKWSDIQEYMPFLYETARSYPERQGSRTGNQDRELHLRISRSCRGSKPGPSPAWTSTG